MKAAPMTTAQAQDNTSPTTSAENHTARIRALNDEFRRAGLLNAWGDNRIVMTSGVAALSQVNQFDLLNLVKAFDDFSEANDPHREHDFGAIVLNGESYFWKIDYYDRKLRRGSPDPADPSITSRVLTVMLASEY